MGDTTQYPSGLFGIAEQTARRLHNAGVDPKLFFNRLNSDNDFLADIIRLVKPNVYDEVPPMLYQGSVSRLIGQMFGYRHEIDDEVLDRFGNEDGLRELLSVLSERQLSIILVRFGVVNGTMCTLEDTAKIHNISQSSVHQHEQKALSKMRKKARELMRANDPEFMESIDSLGLSQRPWVCLKRLDINKLTELTKRSSDDLLKITNFGVKSLNEVRYRLAQRGLTLADENSVPEQIILVFASTFGD